MLSVYEVLYEMNQDRPQIRQLDLIQGQTIDHIGQAQGVQCTYNAGQFSLLRMQEIWPDVIVRPDIHGQ
jgi:hypothetical protein